jgi:hypothetical protein
VSTADAFAAGAANGGAPDELERSLPPVTELAVAALALIVVGGIYIAAHLPNHVPLGVAIGLLAGAGALLAIAVAALSRVRHFAWDKFFLVASRTLLAYVVIAGMLEYVFVLDHTRGAQLVVLTLMLLVFALDIPLLLGFSVARYQPVGAGAED